MAGNSTAHGPGLPELFALANFLVVVAIVYFAGKKGIVAALKARKENISQGLIVAARDLENMRHEIAKAKKDLSGLEAAKKSFVEELSREGQQTYNKILQEAETAAARIVADAKLAANNEVHEASQKIRGELVSAALARVVTLVNTESGPESQRRVHEKFFEDFLGDLKNKGLDNHGI